VADGARNAARGLRYQYLRTLEALMDAAEEPRRGVVAVHVEGLPGSDGTAPDGIDYELTGSGGRVVLAAQVKARVPGSVMGAGEAFSVLAALVEGRDADRYVLLTSAAAGASVGELAVVLGTGLPPGKLRAAIGEVLAGISAGKQQGTLDGLEDEHLARLGRAVVEFDPRSDGEVSESLRSRLRRYRNGARAGLGDQSAGLVIGYLVSEIFRRAGTLGDETVLVSDFRSVALVDGANLARALGRRDWGVVVGPLPVVPDVRRADVLERVQSALPPRGGAGGVPQCTLTGMSGIGKTSLAVGYLLDRADLYDVIFWADAESERALASSYSRIFRYLRGEDAPEPPDPAGLRDAVLTELSCAAGQWLLVLDNCTDERLADSWVPRAGAGHVIMTTINSARPPQGDTRIEVTGMTAVQAAGLLSKRLAPGAQPDGPQMSLLVRLARELEGWPLALELACAYLYGSGLGIDGIPEYLDRLKLASFSDAGSVPRGYPNTLIGAIGLCIEHIRQAADEPGSRDAWASQAALGVLRITAYMFSRQIPVYLVMTVPELDLGEDAFRDITPVVADDPAYPPAKVVQVLRRYSLAAADERLPPHADDGDSNRRYDYTITVNTVLQEVMRDGWEGDRYTGLIVDRLAWHTERWMKAAFGVGAHERAMILAAHASALEGHATRLNLSTDSVAYMRGNLATVLFRQNKTDLVIRLLRSEIDHYRRRGEEHALLLTCQASMQLAAVLAEEADPPAGEIAGLLEDAYLILASFAPVNPEGMASLASFIQAVLSHLELTGVGHERLTLLATAVGDLAGRLPDTPHTTAARTMGKIKNCLHDHNDLRQAADLARTLLGSAFLAEDTPEAGQLRAMARRSLIDALAAMRDMKGALIELELFTADAQPQSAFVREIQELVHNAGCSAALFSLDGVQYADVLLTRLLAQGRAELIESAYPGETSDRIGLLRGADAFYYGDLTVARDRVAGFLQAQETRQDRPERQDGWHELARLLADAISSWHEQEENRHPGPPAREHHVPATLPVPFLAPRVRNQLASCDLELLPIITALAVLHSGLSGTPGTCCVPVCWQLNGAMEHLGLASEVIAARALVTRDGNATLDQVGVNQVPSLEADGSTDGHAVLWAESFGMLVDPTIVLSRHLQSVAQGNPVLSFPVVLRVPDRETLFGADALCSSSRPSLSIMWGLLPQWTQALTPPPGSDLQAGIAYGQLALAHATLQIIQGLDRVRPDLGGLRTLHPQIAAFLDGRSQLPPLLEEPPAAFRGLSWTSAP
jgi:hypothetical protein